MNRRPIERRYLLVGEQLEMVLRRHAAVLAPPALAALGAIIVVAALSILFEGTIVAPLLWLVGIAMYVRLFWKVALWWVDRIFLTDRRLFEVGGLLTRRVGAVPLTKVTDLTYERSIGGRLLGYGSFTIESAGQDQAVTTIGYVPRPEDFYHRLSSRAFSGRRV